MPPAVVALNMILVITMFGARNVRESHGLRITSAS